MPDQVRMEFIGTLQPSRHWFDLLFIMLLCLLTNKSLRTFLLQAFMYTIQLMSSIRHAIQHKINICCTAVNVGVFATNLYIKAEEGGGDVI